MEKNTIYLGDCLELMKGIKDKSVDLIFTSPPYADRRKNTYGGLEESLYNVWFIGIAKQIKRVLKPEGSFFLNIKPHTEKGERVLYVFDLILLLVREVGFKYIDEFCWTKNAFPGKHKGRFKNAFEPVYHFSTSAPENLIFNPEACGSPVKPESTARAFRKQCGAPGSGSGMTAMNTLSMQTLKTARPSNVININNVLNQHSINVKHPAVFPIALPEFFIKSFSSEKALVLDPFAGSGTTAIACINTNRNFICMEKDENYFKIAQDRIFRAALGDLY